MAYNAVARDELESLSNSASPPGSPASSRSQSAASYRHQSLSLGYDNSHSPVLFKAQHEKQNGNTDPFSNSIQSILSRTLSTTYESVNEEDESSRHLPAAQAILNSPNVKPAAGDNLEPQPSRRIGLAATSMSQNTSRPSASPIIVPRPTRTASGRVIPLRHPLPDLQILQGAYRSNVQLLEQTAEKLSMTSSIEDAIRDLHNEQKRASSRQSSLLSSPVEVPLTRIFSNSSSIVEVNNLARSGGYSPGGFMSSPRDMASPRESLSGIQGRSASKSSRLSSRPEPELEGRPLDSFVKSPQLPEFSESVLQRDEHASTLTREVGAPAAVEDDGRPNHGQDGDRPKSPSASITTFDQAQELFRDFDGEHYTAKPREVSMESRPPLGQRRASSGNRLSNNRLSTFKPQTYADPASGQQMVYYPAPVPAMLNLPPKLSNRPSQLAIEKRRSQLMSAMPSATRQNAAWLPEMLRPEDNDLPEDDSLHLHEYMPQHQQRALGGRRITTNLGHAPEQLRANAFFEHPGINELVEVKEDSAVATLDSILDASAYAPVNAFTDHAFAGHLGAEVYGTTNMRQSKSPSGEPTGRALKNRKSSATLLEKRTNNGDLLDTTNQSGRKSIMSGFFGARKASGRSDYIHNQEEEEDDDDSVSDEHERSEGEEENVRLHEGDVYQGPPTTLLAELQLRKQEAKNRIKPITTVYPNGTRATLLELDAVAQVEKRSRNQKRINLAWEDPDLVAIEQDNEDDDDVPLGVLFQQKAAEQDANRPLGLMERREMEDNEPLSRRRDRLQGRPVEQPRQSYMKLHQVPPPATTEDEEETLAERIARLNGDQQPSAVALPTSRPVSRAFSAELLSQFGGDAMDSGKNKENARTGTTTPGNEESETLGQRRRRLVAEREARESNGGTDAAVTAAAERPGLAKRRSMADILQAHPVGNRSQSYSAAKPFNGLLGLHEQQSSRRTTTMYGISDVASSNQLSGTNGPQASRKPNTRQPQMSFGHAPYGSQVSLSQPQAYGYTTGDLGSYVQQQSMMPNAFQHPHAAGGASKSGVGMYGYNNPMAASMLQLKAQMDQMSNRMSIQPPGGLSDDMVERWRQSVMH